MKADSETKTYIEGLLSVIRNIAGSNLLGLYATGSLGFDDYQVQHSDIDILGITQHPFRPEDKTRLRNELNHGNIRCPAHGLDFVTVTRNVAASPLRKPTFDFALATGHTWDLESSDGEVEAELILHLAVCRQNGVTIIGDEPRGVFGDIPRDWILEELASVLHWHLELVGDPYHDPFGQFSTLNACRALHYVERNAFCSKTQGGLWALSLMPRQPLIVAALAHRAGRKSDMPAKQDIVEFVRDICERIEDAKGTQP